MKKIILFILGAITICILIGCYREPREPYLNLTYEGYTNTTMLLEYRENSTIKNFDGEWSTSYLKIKNDNKSQVKYVSSKKIDKCTLLIQKEGTKEKVKELTLDSDIVDSSIPQGKYIYTFSIQWKDGSARFAKLVEIER